MFKKMLTPPSGPGRPSAPLLALLILLVSPVWSNPEAIHVAPIYENAGDIAELPIVPLTTKTVFGFLDFITTVSNTVMVFSSKGGPGNSPIVNSRVAISQEIAKLKNIEPTAALELESVFNSLDNERKHQPFIEVQSGRHDPAQSTKIQPSAVKKTEINEGVTHLQNGLLEIDGAQDEVVYDKFSAEPSLSVEETYRVQSNLATPVIEESASASISQHLSGEALEDNTGAEENTSNIKDDELDAEQEENLKEARESINTLRGRVKTGARKSASVAYKERLKKRLEKEKNKLTLKHLSSKGKSSNRRSFNSYNDKNVASFDDHDSTTRRPSRYKSRTSRGRSRSHGGRSLDTDDVFEEHIEEDEEIEVKSGRSTTGFGSRSRRPTRQRPSFRRNSSKVRESIGSHSSDSSESTSRFKPSRPSLSRNRFSSRITQRTHSASPSTTASVNPTPTKKKSFSSETKSNFPKIEFKKFNRFDRPNLRKNLLNKFFSKRPNNKANNNAATEDGEEEQEEGDLAFPGDHESSPSAFVPSIVDDEDILQNLDNDEIRLERLQTTLTVSTVYPEEASEEYLEVATIRSPYTFDIEDSQKSTRFITVTRTFSKTLDIVPSSSFTSSVSIITPSSSIKPSRPVSSTPLFDTKSIPAPENILASTATPYKAIIEGSSDIETLSPLTLASSLHHATPPLKTVTESLSTVETMIKKSILPVIVEDDTSYYTLSQTYTVTRLVTAVKTIPPMELYEFSPENSFTDFDNLFEEAGSENRESLLPGELEFSDQDNFGLEGPSEIRVAPPQGFLEDLDLIGAKLDFVDHMEKQHNPEIVQLKNSPPSIDSSFGQQQSNPGFGNINQISPTKTQATPLLPDLGGLSGLGVTPEQLLYLQLLQNPLAALGLGGGLQPQVVTESSPVYKTEPVVQTSVIKLFLGAKEFYTTLTQTNGVTTKTDYVYTTKTVNRGLGGLALGGIGQPTIETAAQHQQQPQPAAGAGLGGLIPSYTLVSSPVTRNTVITETVTEQYKIRFRNQPTLTTVTSTKLVSTQVVSYVTKTQRVVATANPLAGLLG